MKQLSPQQRAAFEKLTGTSDPANQLRALQRFEETKKNEYRARLLLAAPEHYSHFVEYMTPDEPPAPHHEFVIEKLEATERRDILRLTLSMPPGHAKTKLCSRYFPAWYLGRNPQHRWLQGGHSQDFVENEIGRYVRDIIAEPEYGLVFPNVQLNPRSTAAGSWRILGARGAYVAKGVGQGISGYRGNFGCIDDPVGKSEDVQSPTFRRKQKKWLMTDFRQRLLPLSPLIIVATRWHADDMIGFAEWLTKEGKGVPWEIINLNGVIENEVEMEADLLGRSMNQTLWPEMYDYAYAMDVKATIEPPNDWFALWKGTPRDAEGAVVKKSWFTRYDQLPKDIYDTAGRVITKNIKRVVISVDCAEKATIRSKYTAAGVWIEDVSGRHYLAEVRRKRVEFPDMIVLIEGLAKDWIDRGYHVDAILVEDAANGTPYLQQRKGLAPAPLITIPKPNVDSKVRRFDGITTMWEGGEVLLPRHAIWLPDYEDELLAFPNGSFSDQADFTSQYLAWARNRRKVYGTRKLGGGNIR